MPSLGCYRQVLRHFSKRTGAIRADSFIHTTAHLPCALSLFLDRVQTVIASASKALAGEKRIAVLLALYQSEQVRKNKPRLVPFTMHVLPAVACAENKNADLISTSFVVIRPAFCKLRCCHRRAGRIQ